MFEKGEYIVYGVTGVCQVMDIVTMESESTAKGRLYYVLHPYYQKAGKIFTPVDNKKMNMRKIIEKEEAYELIDQIPGIESLKVTDDRLCESLYKECIRSCDCRELVKMLKTIYVRMQERLAQGKKITAADERNLKIAEENLYSELSIPLGIPVSQMADYIKERIGFLKECREHIL